ncbi:GAF domain-containing protein [Pedobacter sp. L105]|uniref:GAF domain-containing protein n=1 Tax=Pedobacter sp. L105 TaxID=1641871 RepID=UPI00131C2A8F|nr:GAF domain-containing protein [Pedobacter sp. L105]
MGEKESEKLVKVNRFLKLHISKEKELQEIVELAANICETPYGMISFLDHGIQYVKFSVGTPIVENGYENSFCKQTVEQYDILEVADTTKDPRFQHHPFVVNAPHIRFYAGSPLTTDGGENIGTICVFDLTAKKLSGLQLRMLQSLSRQVTYLLDFDANLSLIKDQFINSKKSETKLRAFFESSSSCHLLFDPALKVISYNKATVDFMLSSSNIHFSESLEIKDFIHPDFLKKFESNCHAALRGESLIEEITLSYPIGDIHWYSTFDPARDPYGKIIGISFNVTNITKSVEAEILLRQQNESLQKIAHLEENELKICVRLINVLMDNILDNESAKQIGEIQLMKESVKELTDKSRRV